MVHAYLEVGEERTPTLHSTPGFNAKSDCEALRGAMKGMGTNEKAIAEILGHRTSEERAILVREFKTMYGKGLIEELQSELGGDFGEVIDALCYPPDVYDAMQLRKAMEGLGTTEDTLVEIMCTRTNSQINMLKEAYVKTYPGRDLEADLGSDVSGHVKRIMVSLVQGNRDENPIVNEMAARQDAQALYEAGEKSLGTDESEFNVILASRSIPQLRAIFREYANLSRDIEEAIKSEMSGTLQDAFIAIVESARNRPQFFAKQLYKSMKGLGTNDSKLIRIIVSRSEIDMGKVKREFADLYEKSLSDWIISETGGVYKQVLTALVGN